MAEVTVHFKNFTGDYKDLNGTQHFSISRRDLLRSTLTLGFQTYSEAASMSPAEWFRRIGKFLIVVGSFQQSYGSWAARESFQDLDMSEKGTGSYDMGMALAKLVAAKFLNVPWLVHVDDMKSKGLLSTSEHTRERGDMVGRDSKNEWHVIEAKGRSSSYSSKLVEKAKRQAASIETVMGQEPATTSACIASLWEDPIEILLDDPDTTIGVAWEMDDKGFWHNYYDGIIEFIRDNPAKSEFTALFPEVRFGDLSELFRKLPEAPRDVLEPLPQFIGLPDFIFSDPRSAVRLPEFMAEGNLFPVGSDGISLLGPIAPSKEAEGRVEK